MDITTRQDALYSGSSLYFTGKACKYGHVCQRYTKSGHCIGCTNPPSTSRSAKFLIQQEKLEAVRQKNEMRSKELTLKAEALRLRQERESQASIREARISAAAAERVEKRQALAEMHMINIHLADRNLALFKETLLALAQSVCPQLVLADVVPNRSPRPGQLYTFRCFGQHVDLLRDLQNTMWRGENTQLVESVRTTVAANLNAEEQAEINKRWPTEDPR